MNLTDLDDYCIYEIFEQLESENDEEAIKDQISLASSHIRFASVFKFYSKMNFNIHNVNILKLLTPGLVEWFYLYVGEFIKILIVDGDWHKHKYQVKLALENCPNLWKLYADDDITNKHASLILKARNLTTILINHSCIDDDFIRELKALPKLEYLSLQDCFEIKGSTLKELPNLNKLNLDGCDAIESIHLKNALSVMLNLEALSFSIYDNNFNYDEVLNNLPVLCKNLKILIWIIGDQYFTGVFKFQSLKVLNFSLTINVDKFIEDLTLYHVETLETLRIFDRRLNNCHVLSISKLKHLRTLCLPAGSIISEGTLRCFSALDNLMDLDILACNGVTNEDLLYVVQNCHKLKFIEIGQTTIDMDFVDDLFKWIKTVERQNGCIRFFIFGTRIEISELSEEYNTTQIKSKVKFDQRIRTMSTSYSSLEGELKRSPHIFQ